jgi:hypothetical protein
MKAKETDKATLSTVIAAAWQSFYEAIKSLGFPAGLIAGIALLAAIGGIAAGFAGAMNQKGSETDEEKSAKEITARLDKCK